VCIISLKLYIHTYLELAHADEVLVDLGEPLLVAVLQVLGEKFQLGRHFFQGLGVVGGEPVFF
jgi:hypothetical protein